MRRFSLLITTLMLFAVAFAGCDSTDPVEEDEPQNFDPPAEGWVLKWHDEFDGTELNRDYWDPNDRYIQNNQNTCYMDSPNNIEVSDGTLKLYVRKESNPCGPTIRYTGARLESLNRDDKYVFYEARLRYPNPTDGFWGNFWTIGYDGNRWIWPPEFDMAEMTSNHNGRIWQTYHYRDDNWSGDKDDDGDWQQVDWTDWHVYAFEWTEDEPLKMYIDGRLTYVAEEAPIWHQFQYLILRMGAGIKDSWGGIPDQQTQWPGLAEYDWVRVWEQE